MFVLQTKLFKPAKRPLYLARNRLINKLNNGLECKFTLVSAPAGFGKSAMLSDWINSIHYPSAWLSLDKEDNDVSRFLAYFVTALKQINKDIGNEIIKGLESPGPVDLDLMLPALVNDLTKFNDKVILVIDDYHVIESKQIQEILAFLLDNLPPHMHLVISGRSDPPISLARFRVSQQMNEFRSDDLRFEKEEVAAYLNDIMKLQLSDDDICSLESKTEGWIASLHLAAISLQANEDKEAFLKVFSGSHRHIIDYLADEVLLRQSDNLKKFLYQTSIFEVFCAELCDFVLGSQDSATNIDSIEKNNLFLISLDDERHWYRYHHLFADILRQRLKETDPDIIPELHRKAAKWFIEKGLEDQAIAHAFMVGDDAFVANLIDKVAIRLICETKLKTMLGIKARLPHEAILEYPNLMIAIAWALYSTGNIAEIEIYLKAIEKFAEKQGENPESQELLGHVTTLRAFIVRGMGDSERAYNECLDVLKQLPEDSFSRGLIYMNLGFHHFTKGDIEQTIEYLEQSHKLNMKLGNYYAALTAEGIKAEAYIVQGRLNEAQKICTDTIELGNNIIEGFQIPATSFAYYPLAKVFYERNDLEKASENAKNCLYLIESQREISMVLSANVMLVKIELANGRVNEARQIFEKAKMKIPSDLNRLYDFNLSEIRLSLWLAEGNMDKAFDWFEKNYTKRELALYRELEQQFTLAKILTLMNEQAKSNELLKPHLLEAQAKSRRSDMLTIYIHMAINENQIGHEEEAVKTFKKALELGKDQTYIRRFIDHGEENIKPLLIASNNDKKYSQYCQKLITELAKYGEPNSRKQIKQVKQALVDPLSDREIEVLLLIAEGLKYQQIADRLFVSINTVRTHTKSIYSKLGTNNKMQAIKHAKELDLIKN